MVVQHNITAMNANRMLNVTTSGQAKSTEKLSSGYKINRAADDAAGLSISEKMRKQIRGLTQGSANAQDGISAVQTAEGALTEVHDMLQRMNELATKAANGTNSASDRSSIQDEISQLTTEIDRVAETSKFNEMYLLKGGSGTKDITVNGHDAGLKGDFADNGATATFTADFSTDTDISVNGKDYHIYSTTDKVDELQKHVGTVDTITIDGTTYTKSPARISSAYTAHIGSVYATKASVATKTESIEKKSGSLATAKQKYTSVQNKLKTATAASAQKVYAGSLQKLASNVTALQTSVDRMSSTLAQITSKYNAAYSAAGSPDLSGSASVIYTSNDHEYTADQIKALIVDGAKVGLSGKQSRTAVDTKNNKNNIKQSEARELVKGALLQANQVGVDDESKVKVAEKDDNNRSTFTITKGDVNVSKELNFSLHVGADADLTNKIGVTIETMNSKYLGVNNLNVKDDTGLAATYAIDAISDAVAKVSAQRSALGAVQNRLEHTIKNLNNVVENTTSAESQIRDTDMATEMVQYSKNNILAQAGQSMLAQANQSNQGVLSLLQ